MTFQAQRAGYKMTQGQAVTAIRAGHTTFAEVRDELNKTAAGRMS
jgi:hypothetical protein